MAAQSETTKVTVLNIGEARKLARSIRNKAADLDRELAALQAQLIGLDAEGLREYGISLDVGGTAS